MKKILFFIVALFSIAIISVNLINAEGITETFDVTFTANYNSTNAGIALEAKPTNAYGDRVNLQSDISGYDFAFWIVNGVVRYDLAVDHEFIVTEDLDIVAVFDNATENPVVFMDANGKLLKTEYVANEGTATPPTTLPAKPGYVTNGWNGSYEGVTEPTVVVLQYTISETTQFTLTVDGGTGSGTYLYNTIVTVEPNESELLFSHWEVNGVVASYKSAYSFTMLENRTVTAVYQETAETPTPIITLSGDLGLHLDKQSFVGQFEFPVGYTLIDYGMISSLTAGPIELGQAGVVKHTGFKIVGQTNEFLMTFSENYRVFSSYLVLEDSLGTLEYYYSSNLYFPDEMIEIGFEDATKNSYTSGSVTLSGHSWTLNDALIGTSATDKKIDYRSLRMQASGYISSDFVFPEGIENIHFLYARYGTDAACTLYLQYALESDPLTWLNVMDGENPLSIDVSNTTFLPANISLNITDAVYFRIIKSGGNRVNIDSLIVNYSGYIDDVNPVIQAPSTVTISQGDILDPLNNVSAVDNFDGDIISGITYVVKNSSDEVVSTEDFSDLPAGEYTINYFVEDSSLNQATATTDLSIIGISWNYMETFTTWNPSSYADNTPYLGIYNIVWSHNQATKAGTTESIEGTSVQLNTKSNNAWISAEIPNGLNDLSIDFKKPFSGDTQIEIEINGASYYSSIITITGDTLTFILRDLALEGFVNLTIKSNLNQTIVDNISWTSFGNPTGHRPVISGATNQTITKGDSFDPLNGITASDFEDGNLTSSIQYSVYNSEEVQITEPIDFTSLNAGEYTIVYSVLDFDNNESSTTITLTINPLVTGLTLLYQSDFGLTNSTNSTYANFYIDTVLNGASDPNPSGSQEYSRAGGNYNNTLWDYIALGQKSVEARLGDFVTDNTTSNTVVDASDPNVYLATRFTISNLDSIVIKFYTLRAGTTIYVQESLDGVNWTANAQFTQSTAITSATDITIDINNGNINTYYRIVFVNSSYTSSNGWLGQIKTISYYVATQN